MMRLRLTDICPDSRVFREDGERLRHAIERRWTDDAVLEIDFENRRVASVSFLDEAIAVLFLKHPPDVVKRRLRPVNITTTDRATLNRQIALRLQERAGTAARGSNAG
jgi:hypothetical protein